MPRLSNNLVVHKKVHHNYRQLMSALAVSLGTFSVGLGKGYSSPALASLQDEPDTSCIRITAQEGSWIASLSFLGALMGSFFGGLMLRMGRRKALLAISLPFSASWLLTVYAHRVEMIYGTSFIAGLCSAVTLLVTQVYVTEIAHPEIRGFLSGILKMAAHLGTLSSFTMGALLNWRMLALACGTVPLLLLLATLWIPESPSYLMYVGKEEEAYWSMSWLRSRRGEEVALEIETLRQNIISKRSRIQNNCSDRFEFPVRQLFITCGLMFFQKFSGVTVFFHYAVPIIQEIHGNRINPHVAAIFIVVLQFAGSMTSGLLIDTTGRLPLLIASVIVVSGGLFGFGMYNYAVEFMSTADLNRDPSVNWIPLTCIILFTAFFAIGIGPISWLMVGELFPLEHRALGGAISTSFSYACAFTVVKTYVDISSCVGVHGAFWIYSGLSLVGIFFVCFVVPETKGMELELGERNNDSVKGGAIVTN